MADVVLPRTCLNCGAPAPRPFCAECGQRSDTAVPTVRSLIREAVSAFYSFDSKLWRTLRLLFSRPGELTKEFMAGRRASYVSPLQLYFWLQALVLFLYATVVPNGASGHRDRAFVVTGLMLAILFRVWFGGRGRPGALHVVCALHVACLLLFLTFANSLYLRILLPALRVAPSAALTRAGLVAVFGTLTVYTVLAVRRAYGEPLGWTIVKMLGIVATLWGLDVLLSRI